MNQNIKLYLALSTFVFTGIVHSKPSLIIDYQGLDKKHKTPIELRAERGVPDGYNLYTDQYRGLIHTIGKGKVAQVTTTGFDFELNEALTFIVPKGWLVYADELFTDIPLVSWDAKDEPWVNVIAKIGANYGMKYIVDFEQQIIQLMKDPKFVKPNFDSSITLDVPNSENSIFIYSDIKSKNNHGGYLLIEGKLVPVTIEQ